MTTGSPARGSGAEPGAEPWGPAQASVLAVLVTTGTTPYLRRALEAVAAQEAAPQALVVVDVASRANGLGDGTPVEEVVEACGVDARVRTRIVRCPEATTFLAAVRSGLERYDELVARSRSRARRRLQEHAPASTAASSRPGTARTGVPVSEPATTTTGIWAQARQEGRLASARREASSPGVDEATWLWLLHDDCAPAPDCLDQLVRAVAGTRSVALAGPKQVDWDHPDELEEVGLRTTASARRANDVAPGEVDQGQLDARSDVLAVGTVGALLSPEGRQALELVPQDVTCFADGLTLSHLVRRDGWRVVVVPAARVAHRRAALLGLRGPGTQPATDQEPEASLLVPAQDGEPLTEGGSDADLADEQARLARLEELAERSFRARRTSQLRTWATFSTRPLGGLLVLMQLLGLARALWRLLQGSARLAGDELAAARGVLAMTGRVRATRRLVAARSRVPASVVAELYVPASEIRALRRDRARQAAEARARRDAPSELELREQAALAWRRRRALAGALVLTAAVAVWACGGVVTTRAVTGGALAGLGDQWRTLWDAAWDTWAPSQAGYATTLSPYLALTSLLTAVGTPLLGSGDAIVHLLLVGALPLAAAGAWAAAGTVTRRTTLRAWAALTWAAAPALTLGVGQGRLAPVLVHLTLPWVLVALTRALGADRRDVIISGMVGARHLSQAEREALAPLTAFRIETQSLANGEDEPVSAPDARETRTRRRQRARASARRESRYLRSGARGDAGARLLARAGADQERYGSGSLPAAGAAGLLLAVVVACAPVLAVVVLAALLVLLLTRSGRRARLLVIALPVAATAAPAWFHAARIALAGGRWSWHHALAYLLTDPGTPVAAPSPDGLDLLLGLPVDRDALAGALPAWAAGLAALACLVPLLLALVSVPVTGARGRRARWGLALAAAGYVLAALAVRHVTAIGSAWDGESTQLVAGWAGTGLSVMVLGLLQACLAGADARRAGLVHLPFGTRHLAVGALTLLGGAVPLVLAGCWGHAAGQGGYAMVLRPASQEVPEIARQMETSAQASRVLLLDAGPQGVSATVWRGDGTQVTDVVPDVLSYRLRQRLDPATAPTALAASVRPRLAVPDAPAETGSAAPAVDLDLTDAADAELAGAVARATAGGDEEVASVLARHAIGVVVLAAHAGDETTAQARAGLASTPGLEALAQTSAGTSWRVDPLDATPPAHAYLTASPAGTDGSTEPVVVAAGEHPTRVAGEVEASTSPRVLVLAERTSSRWHAELDGRALEPTADPDGGWRQAFTIPPGSGGTLSAAPSSPLGAAGRAVILLTWALAGAVCLPLRRRRVSR